MIRRASKSPFNVRINAPLNLRATFAWLTLALSALVMTPAMLRAGVPEVDALVAAEYFSVGGAGFGNTPSVGELSFRKIYAEKDNLEQFVIVYGKGNAAARMYALAAFYRLNRPLYEHLKNLHAKSDAPVTRVMGCDRYSESIGAVISQLEEGRFDGLFPKLPAEAK